MGLQQLQQLLACKDELLVKVLSPFEEATVSTETATATSETATATSETATATSEMATATSETATATSEAATATSEMATATSEAATATSETATATSEAATATSETANAIQEPSQPFKEPTLQARRSQTATEILQNICEGETENPKYEVECFLQKRKKKGRLQYLVKWRGFSREESTWETSKQMVEDLGWGTVQRMAKEIQ
ncbi:uncharacterized protein LOC144927647 [Branchiostoma floridae x Branchiostoma belcheri]